MKIGVATDCVAVLGFLFLSFLATVGFIGGQDVKNLVHLSKWAFMMAFVSIGFSAELSKMKAGIKPFLVGLGVQSSVAVVTSILVSLTIQWF